MQVTKKQLPGFVITKSPNKTVYNLGDTLDLTGLELTLVHDYLNKEVITTGYTVSGYNSNLSGNQTITITYGSYTATFTVVIYTETEGINNGHTYYLMNKQSGKFLDIYADGTVNRTKVQQYHFANCLTEQWKVTYVGNGYYRLQVMHTDNRYLDATYNPINNTVAQIYEYVVCDEQL
ncbi:MAG: RICIN domain-containing protein [Oscillospiraceae bacterium]|nr:RICIN domain-containing protein [Oscillospiraceae bacterium]